MTSGDTDDPNSLDEILRHASREKPSRDVDRMWTRLRDAVEQEPSRAALRAKVSRPAGFRELPHRPVPAAAWAAAVVLLLGGSAFVVLRNRPAERPVAADHVYATGPAQTAKVRLSDGSRVVLAPMSRLSVPDNFGDAQRIVTIDGEGFFDVQHNAAMPFRVRAKNAIAEDIGTRFDVRAYHDENGVAVIVAEGAVTVGQYRGNNAAGAEGVIARTGQRARTGGADGTTTVDQASVRLTDWTAGRLTFVKTPLAEIARTIGRWYDLDVRVTDAAMGARAVTADFDAESPKEMIDALAMAVQGSVRQRGRTLTIGPAR
ncbi:MAG TPA: FecR domain-containing protein [Gemmatimonadaceae bacterium]|jgi:transmembrane sensor|nr:FecR domain-containing protein [Gemmatimonadaceae bacterium]